ncbi:MAG: SGNH/GDSL hydrolase family protein [Burkholderiales bacterium]
MKSNVFEWVRPALFAAVAGAALLSACGGGEQAETFRANRVLAFGDETSFIDTDHSKYSVNAVQFADNTQLDCSSNPIWIQTVAAVYGLVFPECNLLPVESPVSRIYATVGARVAGIEAQVNRHIASGGFTSKDIVTMLVGANDILDQYAQYPDVPEEQLTINVEQAGAVLAAQVNRIANLDAKVLLSTTPDMGYTPFALTEEAANPGRAALLSRLSARFNAKLRANIMNDGRKIGLIKLDEYVSGVAKARLAGGGIFVNTTLAACLPTSPLPSCTTQTLGTDAAAVPPPATPTVADGITWLWADATHLSAGGHISLGSLAVTRALNNPF